jgi:hypothetical protein
LELRLRLYCFVGNPYGIAIAANVGGRKIMITLRFDISAQFVLTVVQKSDNQQQPGSCHEDALGEKPACWRSPFWRAGIVQRKR